MNVLNLEEIPQKHMTKRWTKDALYLVRAGTLLCRCGLWRLSGSGMQARKLCSTSTCRKFCKALMVSCAEFEKRDGLGFEDRQAGLFAGRAARNRVVVAVVNGDPTREDSLGLCRQRSKGV